MLFLPSAVKYKYTYIWAVVGNAADRPASGDAGPTIAEGRGNLSLGCIQRDTKTNTENWDSTLNIIFKDEWIPSVVLLCLKDLHRLQDSMM